VLMCQAIAIAVIVIVGLRGWHGERSCLRRGGPVTQ
jgi:hypothetical protein